jgi:DNA polymerase-3 subunit beta
VERDVLLEAVKRASLVSDNRDRSIVFHFENDLLTIRSRDAMGGQGSEEVEVEYSDKPFEIGFNARYVVDALNQTEAERLVLRMTDHTGPTRVEPVPDDPEHGPVLGILMPQRV